VIGPQWIDGLLDNPQTRGDALGLLAEAAEEAVEAEVVVSLEAWSALRDEQRAALAAARKAWRARVAVQAAMAAASPLERAVVLAEDDGGAALDNAALAAWHAQGGKRR